MNTLDDDLRALLRRQADAMHVPAVDLDQPLATASRLDARRERRWLLPAAAVVLVAIGGVALAQRTTPTTSIPAAGADPSDGSGSTTAPFMFETPTVRLTAAQVEMIADDQVIVPTDVRVEGDPGNPEFTTLELSWIDNASVTQRINFYFASDGVSWWATEIRTTDATGEWVYAPQGQRWFTSPVGTKWTGDLDLPNLRITDLTIEAFLTPAACDDPTSRVAVVSAYPTIVGAVGGGFGGRIDLIDTATCTLIDATPYVFTTVVDDTSIAVVTSSQPLPPPTTVPSEMTTVPGMPPAPTTTIIAPVGTYQVDPDTPTTPFGRFSLEFLRPGTTTVRVTVTDSSGTVIGSVAIPVTVTVESELMTGPTTTISLNVGEPAPVPEGESADVLAQSAYRVELATPALAALGYTESGYTMTPEGVTTITATDPTRVSTDPTRDGQRAITIVIIPGTMLQPGDHSRNPVTVTQQTGNLLRATNQSDNGWRFDIEAVDTSGGTLPTPAQLQALIETIDP